MKKYRISEIFTSVQGEGHNTGKVFVFVRFAGCNRQCSFCDTNHKSKATMTADQIVRRVRKLWRGSSMPPNVLFTGGEPLIQLDQELLDKMPAGTYTAIETNGSITPQVCVDYVTCSPKVDNLRDAFGEKGVDELRYPIVAGDSIPQPNIHADHYYLSPVFDGGLKIPDNVFTAINLVMENPKWQLSIQTHKLVGVR